MPDRSAIIVPLDLPPALAAIRDALDPMAARGVPPHVTILFPFLPVDALDPGVHDALASIASRQRTFVARFDGVQRREDIVWLVPDDQEPFLRLTAAVASRWPAFPPYEGAHPDLIAHLTLVESTEARVLDAASAVGPDPFEVPATELRLITEDESGRWRTRWQLPFTTASGQAGPPPA